MTGEKGGRGSQGMEAVEEEKKEEEEKGAERREMVDACLQTSGVFASASEGFPSRTAEVPLDHLTMQVRYLTFGSVKLMDSMQLCAPGSKSGMVSTLTLSHPMMPCDIMVPFMWSVWYYS